MSDEEYPIVTCPACGTTSSDFDGLGLLCCARCGYCKHPSLTGETCDLCHRRITPMNIDSLRDCASLHGERLRELWMDRDNLSAGCIEFARLQHELARMLGVDMPDIDSFTLHCRINESVKRLQAACGATMKLTGKLFDIGCLEDDKMGFVMRLGDSRLVTVTGFEQDELKALAQHFGEAITVAIGSAAQPSGDA